MQRRFVEQVGAPLASAIRDCAGAPSVSGLLVLAASDDTGTSPAVDEALRQCPVPVFGGRFPGILFEGDHYDQGAVVVSLSAEPTTTVVTELSDPETRVRDQLNEQVAEPCDTTAFVFVDGFADRIEALCQRLFESYGVECTFVGGGAGSLSGPQTPCLFTGEGVIEDGAVLATVEAPSSIGVSHGWEEVDGPFRVNRADGGTLSMLGSESALTVYRRIVEADSGRSLSEAEFFEVAKSYPFGISRLNEEKIVRDPFSVEADGAINCFGEIPEGEFIHVLTGDRNSVIEAADDATRAALASAGAGPLVAFDCISRRLYLDEAFDEELVAIGEPGDPAVGALTIGEIANGDDGHLQFYNKTVVVAQFGTV